MHNFEKFVFNKLTNCEVIALKESFNLKAEINYSTAQLLKFLIFNQISINLHVHVLLENLGNIENLFIFMFFPKANHASCLMIATTLATFI